MSPNPLPLPAVPPEAPAVERRDHPRISVVFGTLNRRAHLEKALDSIRRSCGDAVDYETIVVDGGSTDGSLDYLRANRGAALVVIEQGEPLGAVRAFNAGFAIARGDYVANFNDDAEYIGDVLPKAVAYLDSHPSCGQVAIPFGGPNDEPKTQIIPNWLAAAIHRKNIPYANFGVTRRELGERAGWWGSDLRQYGGDTRLSVEIWIAGYTVDVLPQGSLIHYAVEDATRVPNVETHLLAQHYGAPARKIAISLERDGNRAGGLVRIRYQGGFHRRAVYTDTPSGKVYRFDLAKDKVFYIDAKDLRHFTSMFDDERHPVFVEDRVWRK